MPTPAQIDQTLSFLHEKKLINLDVPLSALVQPEGLGGFAINGADDGPAVLIHHDYVIIHIPRVAQLGINELPQIAESVRAKTDGG